MKKSIFIILIVLWMSFIFSMSSQNGSTSSQTSGGVIKSTIKVVKEHLPEDIQIEIEHKEDIIVESLQNVVRKSAHFIAYMILGILSLLLFSEFKSLKDSAIYAFMLSVIYAASDEFHQLFVPGRSGQIRDVAIDSLGALTGILLSILIVNLVCLINKKRMRVND